VEAVDEARFEELFAGQPRPVAAQSEVKPLPAPIVRRAKTIDPDAREG
jgi:hypothetical protein